MKGKIDVTLPNYTKKEIFFSKDKKKASQKHSSLDTSDVSDETVLNFTDKIKLADKSLSLLMF